MTSTSAITGDTVALTRRFWLACAIGVIAIGLAVHELGLGLPPRARDFTGDALWAVMMYAIVGAVAPSVAMARRAMVALGVCWVVELSQMYHQPLLDAFRGTTLGRLALGTGFDVRDLAAYTVGVAVAVILERTLQTARRRP